MSIQLDEQTTQRYIQVLTRLGVGTWTWYVPYTASGKLCTQGVASNSITQHLATLAQPIVSFSLSQVPILWKYLKDVAALEFGRSIVNSRMVYIVDSESRFQDEAAYIEQYSCLIMRNDYFLRNSNLQIIRTLLHELVHHIQGMQQQLHSQDITGVPYFERDVEVQAFVQEIKFLLNQGLSDQEIIDMMVDEFKTDDEAENDRLHSTIESWITKAKQQVKAFHYITLQRLAILKPLRSLTKE
jgi:hypothetical protein